MVIIFFEHKKDIGHISAFSDKALQAIIFFIYQSHYGIISLLAVKNGISLNKNSGIRILGGIWI